MSRGVNKVTILGNLGQEPEIRLTASQTKVAKISIATSDSIKDKETGEYTSVTEWHSVVFFNKLADICEKYLKKGSKVYIEGSLKTTKWTDKNNVGRYRTEIMGRELQMLDSKNSTVWERPQHDYNHAKNNAPTIPSTPPPKEHLPKEDDEIPF